MRQKVAIIGTNGLPPKYGGFETLCHFLVKHLDTTQKLIRVYCSKTPKRDRLKFFNGAELIYFPIKANGWQSLIYDFVTIVHALFTASDLIVLGSSGAFAMPLNKIFRRNILLNIGGIERAKMHGPRIASILETTLKCYMERICVENSNYVIIDNEAFRSYIVETYGIQPVLAEYGGDHVSNISPTKELLKKYPFVKEEYSVSVARAQEDMNIHLLIDSFRELKNKRIVIISNWNNSRYGKDLFKNTHGKYPNIVLLDAIYQQDDLDFVRGNANMYIHTHSLCGTAPSLVEAMALNLPIVAFDVPTNRYTTEEKALYFKDARSLVQLLKNATPTVIENNRKQMFEIATRRYTWAKVTGKYQNLLTKLPKSR